MINKIKSIFNKSKNNNNNNIINEDKMSEENNNNVQQEHSSSCCESAPSTDNSSAMDPSLVNENTVLEQILNIQGATEILQKYNLPCLTCPMSAMEMNILKLGEVCNMYGLEMEKILEEVHNLKK